MRIPFTKYALKRYNPALEEQYATCAAATASMHQRSHTRYDIINALLDQTNERRYLEIGLREASSTFNVIEADYKISVDPGIEGAVNSATFPVTSDQFFQEVLDGTITLEHDRFDVIFIDGLHLADQVYRDIRNSLEIIADIGFVVLHDCSPPTIHHARENFREQGPATHFWNGTTWKAFQRFRTESDKRSFVVDVDWGIGVIVNHSEAPGSRLSADANPFYEYNVLAKSREQILNLCDVADVPELKSLHRDDE